MSRRRGGGTAYSGDGYQRGTIFELTPQEGGGWKESVIHGFIYEKDGSPWYGLTINRAGNLYGTTVGVYFSGVVFKMARETGGKWIYTVLHRFAGQDASGNNLPGGDGLEAEIPLSRTYVWPLGRDNEN